MVLKVKANDRRKNLALRLDEFRGPWSDVTVDQNENLGYVLDCRGEEKLKLARPSRRPRIFARDSSDQSSGEFSR
ncbi:hypothetical protein TNCV_2650951 [Trichonephila clavipes]|nr:hypothetical protein TNCV_2650951 [Trichonephila clavipes]